MTGTAISTGKDESHEAAQLCDTVPEKLRVAAIAVLLPLTVGFSLLISHSWRPPALWFTSFFLRKLCLTLFLEHPRLLISSAFKEVTLSGPIWKASLGVEIGINRN